METRRAFLSSRGTGLLVLILAFLDLSFAFLPPVPATPFTTTTNRVYRSVRAEPHTNPILQRQPTAASTLGRRGTTALYGIFGLGTPELVVIAVVAAVVLGPDKLVSLARGVGKAAGELKAVPQEFEKGLKTGEEAAMKAKAASKAKSGGGEKSEVDA